MAKTKIEIVFEVECGCVDNEDNKIITAMSFGEKDDDKDKDKDISLFTCSFCGDPYVIKKKIKYTIDHNHRPKPRIIKEVL